MVGRCRSFQRTHLSVLWQSIVLSVVARVCASHDASSVSQSKVEGTVRWHWEEQTTEMNKWQAFNDWACNAPTFGDDHPDVSLATYVSKAIVQLEFGPRVKEEERMLIFGARGRQNTSHNETWIYSLIVNSWRRVDSLGGPSARTKYHLVTLCDTRVILMGGIQVHKIGTKYVSELLDDAWMFDGDKEVWNELVVHHPRGSSTELSVAVRALDKESRCRCNESILIFSKIEHLLQMHKLKCVDDGRVYEWINITSHDAPTDCALNTISYNPSTRYILAMAIDGLWRYSPTEDWQLVNASVSVSVSVDRLAVHFRNKDGVAEKYVLFESGLHLGERDSAVWVYRTSQDRWSKGSFVGFPPASLYTAHLPLAVFSGHLVTYTGTVKPCRSLLWEIVPNWEKGAWIWFEISQTLSPRYQPTLDLLTDLTGDRLYVLGGEIRPTFRRRTKYGTGETDLWQLSLKDMIWERLTPFPGTFLKQENPLLTATGGILHGSVFVVCRMTSELFDTKGYLFEKRTWVDYDSNRKPVGRNKQRMLAVNETSLLMFGGKTVNGEVLRDTWIMTLPKVNVFFANWFEITQTSSDVPDPRSDHTMVRMDCGLVVLYGGVDRFGYCLSDLWYFDINLLIWIPVSLTNRGPNITGKRYCSSTGSAVGQQVFFAITTRYNGIDGAESSREWQIWMYSIHSGLWVFVSSSQALDEYLPYSMVSWKQSLIMVDTSNSQLFRMRVGCPAGYASVNIEATESPCQKCSTGNFSAAGASECSRCPNGLLTPQTTSTSILNCTKCDAGQCKHGECLVIQISGIPRPTCRCSFGYTGSSCQYPTYFLIGLGVVAFVLLLVIAVVIVVRVQRNRRRREASLLRQVSDLNDVWQISDTEIELFDRIGSGASGEVFRASYRDMTVAVKILNSPEDDDRMKYEFEREIQFMQTIRHPNIVLFIGAGKFYSDTPFIVIEFMESGSVRDLLSKDGEITEEQKVGFWAGVAKGMRFLHALNPPRIHRDLKCSNLLISRNSTVKIADFGLGREVEHKRRRRSKHAADITYPLLGDSDEMTVLGIGTVQWRAPEMSAGMNYSTAVDVYR